MNIFLSHARKDGALARKFSHELKREGFVVWDRDLEIEPGENWAKNTGMAMDAAVFIVLLLPPDALLSDSVRSDIEYVLGASKFKNRLFSVFVGPSRLAAKHFPWILRKLPHRQLASDANLQEAVSDI